MNLGDWLDVEVVSGFSFTAERWTEREGDRDALVDALGRRVLSDYTDRDWLLKRLESMGHELLAKLVKDTVLPPAGNTRTGDFGEIVSAHLLRRHKKFLVPVSRLRYKDAPNGTQRLIDIVAFQFRKPPNRTIIAACEVKARTNSEATIAVQAADQLTAAIKDLPLSLSYIDRRLTTEGRHSLANRVAALLDPDAEFDVEQHVCAVTDPEVVHAEVFDRLEAAESYEDISASVVLLKGLGQLISDSYESASQLSELQS